MKLTDTICRATQPKTKPYKLFDGGGLFLFIHPNGSKYWRHKYRIAGKETQISYGGYPEVSLKYARLHQKRTKQLLKDGLNPMELRREEKKDQPKPLSKKNTFNLALSEKGHLTIETPSRIIQLMPEQTESLRHFLIATDIDGEDA